LGRAVFGMNVLCGWIHFAFGVCVCDFAKADSEVRIGIDQLIGHRTLSLSKLEAIQNRTNDQTFIPPEKQTYGEQRSPGGLSGSQRRSKGSEVRYNGGLEVRNFSFCKRLHSTNFEALWVSSKPAAFTSTF
jgi:hypothetical protein